MAKSQTRYVCQECGAVQIRWAGRCDACGAWNTLEQEIVGDRRGQGRSAAQRLSVVDLRSEQTPPPRLTTGLAEIDRVTGDGFVPGSALLMGGDPGIGKSTLLLQVCARLAHGTSCLYVSGEEAVEQVRLRARRLGLAEAPVKLAAGTDVRAVGAAMDQLPAPAVVVLDSIQTMVLDSVESAPGSVAQVRAAAQELIRHAKESGHVVVFVGHVTKEGTIAGPRVLEHMVDAVLSFEGERSHQFRILRAAKNRFGPADEIGVFEMTDAGLAEVANPSALFLADRRGDISGAAVFAGMEGTRPVLLEVQSLVASSALATPRRAVVGWDSSRLAMLIAVLEARCGVVIGPQDVYLNIAGGLRIAEPAADLAVAAALISALSGQAVPQETVIFGEIGLSGEVRPVGQQDQRLKEAAKLGFTEAWTPPAKGGHQARTPPVPDGLTQRSVAHVRDLLALLGAEDLTATS